jgi:hypothetical protein
MPAEYLTLQFSGSKGCISKNNNDEMIWNNVRLIVTENGVTKVQTLAGGMERMDEHVNNYLNLYSQQGWETIKVERPEETTQVPNKNSQDLKKNIMYILKRSGDPNNELVFRNSNTFGADSAITPPSALEKN